MTDSTSSPASTRGAHHIGLTVPDVAATQRFFVASLGFRQVGAKPDYPAVFLSDGHTMITLWQVADPSTAIAFDRKKIVGLHHFALRVADGATLDRLHRDLAGSEGVRIEFAPEPLGSGPSRHMMLEIPGGIRMELIAPAA